MVPTVERGLLPEDFCEIEIDGLNPLIWSTSGLGIWPKNWRANVDRLSTYRRWPSAYSVSNASELLPLPETPVRQISLFRGSVTSTLRRLCSRAPRITISEAGINAPLYLQVAKLVILKLK